MEFKKVELSDREVIEKYLSLKKDKCCDMTFANIYLWSRKYKVKYTFVEDCLVFTDVEKPWSFSFPYGKKENQKKAIAALYGQAQTEGQKIRWYLVTPSDFEMLEQWFPGEFQIEYDRDIADYVYDTAKLVNLSGRNIMGRRIILTNLNLCILTGPMKKSQMKMWKSVFRWR